MGVLTRLRPARRSRGGMGDFYEVDAVTVFLKNKDASITKRILTSKQLGVNFVSTVDQRVRPRRGNRRDDSPI